MIDVRRWTIRRGMIAIALLAPLLALARYPFALGFVGTIGLLALVVGLGLRARRYGRLAGLLIGYPLLPLLILHLQWAVITLRFARRSSVGLLDGMFGVSDIGAMACLVAYAGCIAVWLGGRGRWDAPEARRAARRVVLWLPPAWTGLFAVALWDPFGALGYLIHF